MGLVVVNIGGIDLADGNKKLILALLWQLMRRFTLQLLAEVAVVAGSGGNKTAEVIDEKAVVKWANEKIATSPPREGGDSSRRQIRGVSDKSLMDGLFLIELCYAVSARTVDWSLVHTDHCGDDEKFNNARYAISIARKIGACVFLAPEDITEVKPKMIFVFMAALWCESLKSSCGSGGGSTGNHEAMPAAASSLPSSPPKPPIIHAAKPTPTPQKNSTPTSKPLAAQPPATATLACSKGPTAIPAVKPVTAKASPANAAPAGVSQTLKRMTLAGTSERTSLAGDHPDKQPKGFKSINGSGEKGGVYGATSGYVNDDNEVEEDE